MESMCRPIGYERVYLPLYKVANTPFLIQRDAVVDINVNVNINRMCF